MNYRFRIGFVLGLSLLGFTGPIAQAQSPFLLNEFPPHPSLATFYQQRGVAGYTLTNYQVYQGDTLSRGVYKTVALDRLGRTIVDSTATAMGRQYRFQYNEAGKLVHIVKKTAKGEGYFQFVLDSLGRCLERIEISHRQDTNEVCQVEYDPEGRLFKTYIRTPTAKSITTYSYDQADHLTQDETLTTTIKGEFSSGTRYLYNSVGQLTGIRDLKEGVVRQVDDYRYNELGQVIERILPGKVERYRYFYDGQGLLLGVEVYDQRSNQLKGWQVYAYTFY